MLKEQTDKATKDNLSFFERIELALGKMLIRLSATHLAKLLDRNLDGLESDALSFETQFQLRKRGIETKIIIADGPTGIDEALIHNIAKANLWYGLVKRGQTFKQIAQSQNTS